MTDLMRSSFPSLFFAAIALAACTGGSPDRGSGGSASSGSASSGSGSGGSPTVPPTSCADGGGCTGHPIWSERFGDASPQLGDQVVFDRDDNVIFNALSTSSAVSYGGAPIESWALVKLDPTGKVLWSQPGTGPLATGPSGEIVRGMDAAHVLDPSGKELWSTGFEGAAVQGVAVDAKGDVFVTGVFVSPGHPDFGGGPVPAAQNALLVAELDPTGKVLWGRAVGAASDYNDGSGIAVDAAGNVVVVGIFSTTLDIGAGPIQSVSGNDVFVAKLDPSGKALWSKELGTYAVQAPAVGVDAAGNVVVAGTYGAVSPDFGGGPLPMGPGGFVVELDPSGAHVWSQALAAGGVFRGLAVGAGGDVAVAGALDADPSGTMLTILLKLDRHGSRLWSIGSPAGPGPLGPPTAYAAGAGVAMNAAGEVVFTGQLFDSLDLGSGTLTSAGQGDVFVAKYGR